MISGLRLSGFKQPLLVHDRNPEKLRALREQFSVEIAFDLKTALERAKILLIAVRPMSVAKLLRTIANCESKKAPTIAVSLAAGVPLKNLRRGAPQFRWARAMPSPVSRVARGLTALAFEQNVPEKSRKEIRQFFQRVGPTLDIPESQFDAYTAAFSSTHGYHALNALANAAQEAGLDAKTALTVAAHALGDGIAYWRESGESLADLLDEAATPGGTAAATMAAMSRAGYEKAVAKGLDAGIAQARRNAKR